MSVWSFQLLSSALTTTKLICCDALNSFHAGAFCCLEQRNMNAPEQQLDSSPDIELGKIRQEGADTEIEVLPNGMRNLNHTEY